MPQEFDPYHRWLGIPPEEQPADHYRLLGLVRFEDDIEVIRDAAERQIAHVRRYGLGKHSELSQRILNELAGAKACLLVPETKTRYDAQLRKTQEPPPLRAAAVASEATASVAPSAPPRLPPAERPTTAPTQAVARSDSQPPRPVLPRRGRGPIRRWVIGGACAAGAALAGLLVWVVFLRGDGAPPAETHVAAGEDLKPGLSKASPGAAKTEPETKPPSLAPIADQIARQGQPLQFTATLADRGTAAGPLLFSLVQSPAGARIDAVSGVFTWTPGAAEARTRHAVTVQVAARDASDLTDRASFVVEVQEALLLAPQFEPIKGQTLEAGATRAVQIRASDRNLPRRKLVYELGDAPSWARIDPSSGTITLHPPEDEKRIPHRIVVRARSDAANAPLAEASFTVVLTSTAPAPADPPGASPEADLAGLAEVKGLSGALAPSGMDLSQIAMRAAQELASRVGSDPKVMPLFAGEVGGPVAAVCEYNKTSKQLDGRVIEFFPGKDPITRFNARFLGNLDDIAANPLPPRSAPNRGPANTLRSPSGDAGVGDRTGMAGVSALQMSHARERAAQAAWADVGVQAYLEFRQGNRHGAVATWDESGRRAYWGNYQRGQRHDFCCLFKNGEPRIIVVFDQDEAGPVYLISANQVAQHFTSHEEALHDATAKPLLAELDNIESQLKQRERMLEGRMKKTVQAMLGNLHQYQRFLEQQRRSMRDLRQKQNLQDQRKKAAGFR